ncbi:hypothetical protein Tco_0606370 [Tanacetum coccineum]
MVAYLKNTEGSEGFHQIVDFLNASHIRYALTENPTIYVSLINQFWQTATTSTLDNGEIEISATIDGKVKIVTEASIRRHLKLKDSDGIITLPTTEIFEQLAFIGSKKTAWEQFSSNIATAIICLATSRRFNFSKLIFDGIMRLTSTGRRMSDTKGFLQPPNVTSLDGRIQGMKRLERAAKSSQARRREKIVVSDNEDDAEDSSKQRRKIDEIDQDPNISLVQHDAEIQGRHGQDMEFETEVYTAEESVSTAGASMPVSTAGMVQEVNISIPLPIVVKDKGKGKMEESEDEQTKRTKLQQEQDRLSHEAVVRLQEELDEEERQRMARVHEAAQSFTEEEWENI